MIFYLKTLNLMAFFPCFKVATFIPITDKDDRHQEGHEHSAKTLKRTIIQHPLHDYLM